MKTLLTAKDADIRIGRTLSNSTPFAIEVGGELMGSYSSIELAAHDAAVTLGRSIDWIKA